MARFKDLHLDKRRACRTLYKSMLSSTYRDQTMKIELGNIIKFRSMDVKEGSGVTEEVGLVIASRQSEGSQRPYMTHASVLSSDGRIHELWIYDNEVEVVE